MKHLYRLKKGKGTYGLNNIQIVEGDLLEISVNYEELIQSLYLTLDELDQPKTYQAGTNITITNPSSNAPTINASFETGDSGFIPYVGATQDVNLGDHELKLGKSITINEKGKYDIFLKNGANRPILSSNREVWNSLNGNYDGIYSGIAVGEFSQEEANGNYLTSIGKNSMRYSKGNYNTSVGHAAGYLNTEEGNVFMGYYSGRFNTGVRNTLIGTDTSAGTSFKTDYFQQKVISNTDLDKNLNTINIPNHGYGPDNEYVILKFTKVDGNGYDGINSGATTLCLVVDSNTIKPSSFTLSGSTSTSRYRIEQTKHYSNVTAIGAHASGTKDNQVALGGGTVEEVKTSGDYRSIGAGKGVVLTTPDGTKQYRISIDNSGSIITTLIT